MIYLPVYQIIKSMYSKRYKNLLERFYLPFLQSIFFNKFLIFIFMFHTVYGFVAASDVNDIIKV